MAVSAVQLLNAEEPMAVKPSGRVIFARAVQLLNAFDPMLVTPLGIVISVRSVRLENAFSPMVVTLPSEGMAVPLPPAISVLASVAIRQLPAE